MSEETKKIELTEQELDQVAGGMRKAGKAAGSNKSNNSECNSLPPVVLPIVGKPSAG